MIKYKTGDKVIVIRKDHPLYLQIVTIAHVSIVGGIRAAKTPNSYRFAFSPDHIILATKAARILYGK